MQFSNISFILVALFVFHLEISGNDDNEEHEKNLISLFFLVFHLGISGKDNNNLQLINI